jgi:hypothetical protein
MKRLGHFIPITPSFDVPTILVLLWHLRCMNAASLTWMVISLGWTSEHGKFAQPHMTKAFEHLAKKDPAGSESQEGSPRIFVGRFR